MTDEDMAALSQRTGEVLREAALKLATAESCTGGWVAKIVTDSAGSSEWFTCGLTTYSDQAKGKLLGVSDITLERNGAVSEETAFEMVEGALYRTDADIALAVTGIAGPGGGSAEKPVGTVCFAWGRRNEMVKTETRKFDGDREHVRRQSVVHALNGLLEYIAHPPAPVRALGMAKRKPIAEVEATDAEAKTVLRKGAPFDVIDGAKADLAALFDRLRLGGQLLERENVAPAEVEEQYLQRANALAQEMDFPAAVQDVVRHIQRACELDADAMVGFAHLDVTGPYTVLHPLHQAVFGEVFARYIKMSVAERMTMACAALTTNIAMLDLQEILWRQASPLTELQHQLVQLHPAWSREMLVRLGVTDLAWLDAVQAHHERADGKGYPAGTLGDQIPFAARMIALTDIYDAMVTPRQHRAPNPRAALRDLFLKRGQAIDAELSAIAIKGLGIYPPGTFVKLQNGEVAIVIKRVPGNINPIVRSLVGPRGAPLERFYRRTTDIAMFKIQDVVSRDPSVRLDLRRIWDYPG